MSRPSRRLGRAPAALELRKILALLQHRRYPGKSSGASSVEYCCPCPSHLRATDARTSRQAHQEQQQQQQQPQPRIHQQPSTQVYRARAGNVRRVPFPPPPPSRLPPEKLQAPETRRKFPRRNASNHYETRKEGALTRIRTAGAREETAGREGLFPVGPGSQHPTPRGFRRLALPRQGAPSDPRGGGGEAPAGPISEQNAPASRLISPARTHARDPPLPPLASRPSLPLHRRDTCSPSTMIPREIAAQAIPRAAKDPDLKDPTLLGVRPGWPVPPPCAELSRRKAGGVRQERPGGGVRVPRSSGDRQNGKYTGKPFETLSAAPGLGEVHPGRVPVRRRGRGETGANPGRRRTGNRERGGSADGRPKAPWVAWSPWRLPPRPSPPLHYLPPLHQASRSSTCSGTTGLGVPLLRAAPPRRDPSKAVLIGLQQVVS